MTNRLWKALTAGGAVVVTATPAWAHAAPGSHLHGTEVSLLLAMVVGLVGLNWIWRRGTRQR